MVTTSRSGVAGRLSQNDVVKPVLESKTHVSHTFSNETDARECLTMTSGIGFGALSTFSIYFKMLISS